MSGRPLRTSLLLIVLVLAIPALAAPSTGGGVLNDVTERFYQQSEAWGGVIQTHASWLFWLLATISMVWTFGMMALRRADLGEFFAEFLRFTMTTGFFWWLLTNGPSMAVAIIESMQEVGARAANLPAGIETLTPSSPISLGLNIVKKAYSALNWVHPIDNLAVVIVTAVILLCLCVVAANILIALVNAWVMAFAGIFVLGFGGARWTSDIAIAYFKAMLGVGLELMTMTLLLGIAISVINGFYEKLDGASLYELLVVFCVCAVLALLIHTIPGRIAALAGGGSGASLGAGAMIGGAISAATMGAAAAASAGAALAAGAASAAGGAQALMAAFSKANSFEDSGGGKDSQFDAGGYKAAGGSPGSAGPGGLAAAMGDSVSNSSIGLGSLNESGRSESADEGVSRASSQPESAPSGGGAGGGKTSGASNGATAMAAKVGRIAMGTAANLAQGAWDVSKEKMATVRDSAVNRAEETTGGKIAAAINARGSVMMSESGGNSGVDDKLAAGGRSSDPAAEIAAFRDRDSNRFAP